MTVDVITAIASEALFTIIQTAAPVLVVSLVVGLTVSVFQTATSIQEQTLTFVPKIISIFLTLMLIGHWMLNNIITFMTGLWTDFAVYVK